MEKYDLPSKMTSSIGSLHEGMLTELKINGKVLEGGIRGSNELKGNGPTLFDLNVNLVVEMWCQQCSEGSITVLHKLDG